MASYSEKAAVLFGPLGQKASEQIVAENRDLFLSIDEGAAFSAIASYARLHMDELEPGNTLESVAATYKNIIGILLHSGKIAVATFGLSKRGKKQFDALIAAFRPAPEDPCITEYKQFNASAHTVDYQLRMASDEGFRTWANATK